MFNRSCSGTQSLNYIRFHKKGQKKNNTTFWLYSDAFYFTAQLRIWDCERKN